MKKALLVSLLMLNSVGLVACSKDKDKSAKEQLHDCMWDETGDCQDKLAAALNDPKKRALIEKEIAANPGLARKFQSGTLTGADWNAVQAHAQVVLAKTTAIANDPNSSFYEPPGSYRAPASVVSTGLDPTMAQVVAATPNAPTVVLPASVEAPASVAAPNSDSAFDNGAVR
jgi:hypothetical protein